MKRLLLVLITTQVLLSGCQSLMSSDEAHSNIDPMSLEALQPAALDPVQNVAPVSLEEVIASYTELLPLLQDPDTQIRVLHRLADLKLAKGEVLMSEQAVDELDIAVGAYTGLLQQTPDRAENDRVLYQLAKTYDLQGKVDEQLSTLDRLVTEYPGTPYLAEAQFRRGEILFTDGRYAEAEQAFAAVIEIEQGKGVASSFLANSHYMRGWSRFKQNRYEAALHSYAAVLDLVMPEQPEAQAVESKHRTMVEDLFRVMGLSFNYLGGADAVEDLFERLGSKPWEILVYHRYSDLLLDKEQYSDAIAVYEAYIANHPLTLWAPRYQIRIIETLQRAGFRSDIQEQKVRFVREYAKGGAFWAEHSDDELTYVKEQLEWLLPELANRHYVKAQRSKGAERRSEYESAIVYLSAFVDTFPAHPRAAEHWLLLGESAQQLQDWPQAIAGFEQAGYAYPEFEQAAEAAYASVLAYDSYLASLKQRQPKQVQALRAEQQLARLRFVDHHSGDARASDVLYLALLYDFDGKDYPTAVTRAQRLIDWQPRPSNKLVLEAAIIKAHSLFALRDNLLAEQAYQDVLVVMPLDDQRHTAMVENLAASVYRQAEDRLAAGDKAAAVDEFLRVGKVAPSSSLRPNAEYDALNFLMELEQWPRAIQVMTDFRARYPQHVQINTLVPKLALAYRETEQWELAANELKKLFELAETEEERRDALQIAAELYDRAGNTEQAILSYRKWANTYSEPLDVYMETMHRLAELYREDGQPLKRRFWLAKQMKTVDQHRDKADDR
ncbi:MAG: tetratricopeptide repeat protein, partial [Oleiphilaceae bacterium]|nr:tetratricopeptide repeat protein [Oleiphilaceae bacterium]